MRENRADLLIHPVRLRIVQAFFGDRRLAAEDLAELLADIPQATLYRHLARLAEAEVLVVVEEQPARGTPRRIYALAPGGARVSPDELAALSAEEQMRSFTLFVGTLLGDFARWVAQDDADAAADGVSYRQFALNLSDAELHELARGIGAAIAPMLGKALTPERRRRVLTTIMIPTEAVAR